MLQFCGRCQLVASGSRETLRRVVRCEYSMRHALARFARVGARGCLALSAVTRRLRPDHLRQTIRAVRPTSFDKVRAIDLLPRFPHRPNGQRTGPPDGAQPQTYFGTRSRYQASADAAGAQPAPSGEGYELNFENTPVPASSRSSSATSSELGYLIDPRVQGTVTPGLGPAGAEGRSSVRAGKRAPPQRRGAGARQRGISPAPGHRGGRHRRASTSPAASPEAGLRRHGRPAAVSSRRRRR